MAARFQGVIDHIFGPPGYERVYLPLWKVTDTPFHTQGDGMSGLDGPYIVCSSEYATVQQKGQTAVDAIDNYNTVVEALSASLEMALQANQSMMATLAVLKNVSVEELATEAVQALDQAEVLKARASAQDGTATRKINLHCNQHYKYHI